MGRVVGSAKGQETISSIQSLPFSPTERASAFAGALQSAPSEQLDVLIKGALSDGDDKTTKSATNAYISRLFALDKTRAITWVKATPPGIHSYALSCLVVSWFRLDAEGVMSWIKELDRGPDRDLSLSAYIDLLSKTDPTMARALAAEIDDPGLRKNVLRSLPSM